MRHNLRWHLSLSKVLIILFGLVFLHLEAFAAPPSSVSVSVVNTSENPVPVVVASENPVPVVVVAQPPGVFKKQILLGEGGGWQYPPFQDFTVPEGQRIVIEFLSARGCVASGLRPELLIIEMKYGSGVAQYRFGSTVPVNGMGGLQCFVINEQMRVYLDAGSVVRVAFNGTFVSTTDFIITLSGQVLNAP